MTKDDIRKQILAKRDSLTPEDIREKSRSIFEALVATQEYMEADTVLIYASMRSEVITDDIILDSLSEGKRVFCPKVTDKTTGTMEFVRIYSMEDLKEGYFGIREPELTEDSGVFGRTVSAIEYTNDVSGYFDHDDAEADATTLVIMPGVAFDSDNNRIGYSGGFYDRFLEKNPQLTTIALCFKCQLCEELIPADAHDMRPQKILSESI